MNIQVGCNFGGPGTLGVFGQTLWVGVTGE